MNDLLFLVHRIPYPPNKGDKIRSYHLLKFLAREFHVHVGTFIDDAGDEQYVKDVQALCGETYFGKLTPPAARLRSARGFLTGQPLTLPYYYDAGLRRWVDDLVRRRSVRRVLAFSSSMAQYAEHIKGADTRRVIDFVDVDSDKWAQYAPSKPWPLSWVYGRESTTLLRYERHIARTWDAGVFVSKDEAALFQRLAPESAARIYPIYNGVDSDYFSPARAYANPYAAGGPVLVFTGAMDYWANVDAVVWFAHEVFPRVRAQASDARFFIVGSHPSAQVRNLGQTPGISVTGSVADVRPYLRHAHAAVAPLRIARGIQNKVLEALAMARPVIATSAAAEGLVPCPNQALRVADDPETFASHALAALKGDAPHDAGLSGRACVVRHYDWAVNVAQFADLLRGAANSSVARASEGGR